MFWSYLRFPMILVSVLASFVSCKPAGEAADLVFTNAKVYTVDETKPRAEAIAITSNRIVAVGSVAEIAAFRGEHTRVIDLKGALVLPGLIEGHGHLMGIGQAAMNLRLMETRNWNEIVAMVAAAAAKAEPGQWILGRGWHQEKWDQAVEPNVKGFPTHDALSAVSPDNPVLLSHASGHAVFANAKAMALAGVDATTPDPPGGEILRDGAGNPSGVFSETAESLVDAAYRRDLANATPRQREDQARKAVRLAVEECLAKGITSFQDAGSSFSDIELFKNLADEGKLGLRLWVMIGVDDQTIRANFERYRLRDYADHFLTVGAIKRYADGALGSRGAWLLAPYEDQPDSNGQNVTPLDELRESAALAKELGIQLCTHAIGDRGNREMLDIYEATLAGEDRRWRIEHAQHLDPADIPRFAKLHVIASMQGIHATSDAPFVAKRLGSERAAAGAYVWRKLLDSGAHLANGTDAPVEDVNPLANLYALVSRETTDGTAFYADQKLTIAEAIRLYTLDNAYAAYQETQKGSITPGKLADLTILSKDFTNGPPASILEAEVLYTVVNGEIRYRSVREQ